MKTNNDSKELQRYIELFNDLLDKFVEGGSMYGLMLRTDDEAKFKGIIIEVIEFLKELFGENNTYALNIINTVNDIAKLQKNYNNKNKKLKLQLLDGYAYIDIDTLILQDG